MKRIKIDSDYLIEQLKTLLSIPSPAGYTDSIVHYMGEQLKQLGIPFELTRRGAIRADMKGKQSSPDRAIVAHLDTLGAIVKGLKENGRLEVAPIGTWSARFAEGARVSIFSDEHFFRGSILPLKASGHVFDTEIDTQPVSWENLELRVDANTCNKADLEKAGINVGDFIAIDPQPEFDPSGFINSRHLDNKAGVALLLAAAKSLIENKVDIPVDCHFLFTISEEVGSGASAVLHGDIAEMVSIDNATPAPGQNSTETGVTVAMMDSTGPFDYHLTHKLLKIATDHQIPFARDVFKYYRCDAASAIEAGNDLRTALLCFGCDGSHGYERTHIQSLTALAELLTLYVQSPPAVMRDRNTLGPISGFPTQPTDSPISD